MTLQDQIIFLERQLALHRNESEQLRTKNSNLIRAIEFQNDENEWLWQVLHSQQKQIWRYVNIIQMLKRSRFFNN